MAAAVCRGRLAGLEDAPRPGGPKTVLTEDAIAEIPSATVTPPPEALRDQGVTHWSARRLADWQRREKKIKATLVSCLSARERTALIELLDKLTTDVSRRTASKSAERPPRKGDLKEQVKKWSPMVEKKVAELVKAAIS